MAKVIHKYISGFLNTEGGTLLYGVRDDGVAQGIKLSRSAFMRPRLLPE